MAARCGRADLGASGDVKNGESPDEKKPRLELDVYTSHKEWKDLADFELVSILKNDADSKLICIHAQVTAKQEHARDHDHDGDNYDHGERDHRSSANGIQAIVPSKANDAVILLEKTPFDSLGVHNILSHHTTLKKIFSNDIYGTYEGYPDPAMNALRTTVIYPATAKHLEKYRSHDVVLINEAAEDYVKITLPWIQSESFPMQWIYNILEKKTESEFILFEDPDPETGFILLPDMKWDRKQLDNLYLSAIVHARNIKSLRDLSTQHLPLLRNILSSSLKTIHEKYGLPAWKIRAYFHYQPSYYHLHVHFNQVKHIIPGSNVLGAHLLSDVIDNIELVPDYYQRKTLPFACKVDTKLFAKYKDNYPSLGVCPDQCI